MSYQHQNPFYMEPFQFQNTTPLTNHEPNMDNTYLSEFYPQNQTHSEVVFTNHNEIRSEQNVVPNEEKMKISRNESTLTYNRSSKEDGKKVKKKKQKRKVGCDEEDIHVRAKRGEATNIQSLAERVRREKISERMRVLQRLVPGCDMITGKVVMLDEVINYVQSLRDRVEFLSMKLASIDPLLLGQINMDAHPFFIPPESFNNMEITTFPFEQQYDCNTCFDDATTTSNAPTFVAQYNSQ